MKFFKKKEHPVAAEIKCPAEGCALSFKDEIDLKKHIEWKHPEITLSNKQVAKKVK